MKVKKVGLNEDCGGYYSDDSYDSCCPYYQGPRDSCGNIPSHSSTTTYIERTVGNTTQGCCKEMYLLSKNIADNVKALYRLVKAGKVPADIRHVIDNLEKAAKKYIETYEKY